MIYEEPKVFSHDEINKIIIENNVKKLCYMLIGVAFNEQDLDFAYFTIYKFLFHDDINVVGVSIICLAHLSRIHGNIPEETTINAFKKIINSKIGNADEIRSRMGDALGDFSVFQPKIFERLYLEFPEYFKAFGF